MKSSLKKPLLPDNELQDGIIFQRFDLSTGGFSGCLHLLFDGEQLILTSVTAAHQDLPSIDELRRDDSGKSMAKIYREQRHNYLNDPLTKHRRIRSQQKRKR